MDHSDVIIPGEDKRSVLDQRQIRRYEQVEVVREVPARSWGIITRKDISTQTQ